MNMQGSEYVEYFNVALGLVKKLGGILGSYKTGCKDYEKKSSDIDFVTEMDTKIEEFLIAGLSEKFPTHKYIGEETVSSGQKCVLTDDPTWVIDPVDGTMNFVHGFPHCCISLALLINKVSVVGFIYNPMINQLFCAVKDKGAYCNETRIHVSDVKALKNALVMFEAGTSRDEERQRVLFENYKKIITTAHGTRTLGSAALNMAMVAWGGADVYFEFGIHAWDMAAGDIIVREAGGVCMDPAGGPFDILSRRMIAASSPELGKELAETIVQFYPERD